MTRISLAKASDILCMSEQTIRILMQRKALPIGEVFGKKRKTYVIYQEWLDAYARRIK